MENRAVVILLAFLLIGGFGFHVNYTIKLEDKRRDMIEAQDKAKSVEDSVAGMRNQIAAVQKDLDAARAKFGKLEALVQAKVEADRTEAEYPLFVAAYQKAVKQVRETAVGTELPQLKLPNGPLLTSAKITKTTDTEFTVSHAGGVSRIAVKDLPPDLQDKFRFDDPLMKVGVSVALAAKPPSAVAAPLPSLSKSNVNQEKVALLRKRIDETTALKVQALTVKSQWDTKVSEIQSKHSMNKIMGRSDSSAVEVQTAQKSAAQAQANANALDSQLTALKAELNAVLQAQ